MQHTMKQVAAPRPAERMAGIGIPMWALAVGTTVFGAAALYIIIQSPAALPLAAMAGVFAVVARVGYGKLRTASRSVTATRAEASGAVANVGLVIAAVAVAPLIAFALLWTALLLIIGAAWLMHILGIA